MSVPLRGPEAPKPNLDIIKSCDLTKPEALSEAMGREWKEIEKDDRFWIDVAKEIGLGVKELSKELVYNQVVTQIEDLWTDAEKSEDSPIKANMEKTIENMKQVVTFLRPDLPGDVITEILSDLPVTDINTLRKVVHEKKDDYDFAGKLKTFSRDEKLWKNIAEQIGVSSKELEKIPGTTTYEKVKGHVIDVYKKAKAVIPEEKELSLLKKERSIVNINTVKYETIVSQIENTEDYPEFIKSLLESEPKPDTIVKATKDMEMFLRARDTLIVWKEINQQSGINDLMPDLSQLNSLDKWTKKAKEAEIRMENCKDVLSKLKKLNLEDCEISYIPDAIRKLSNLKKLNLEGNLFIWFPKVICELTTLEKLELDENEISEIPKEIGNLKNLKKLNLEGNRISVISKEIGKLENLEELFLQENEITKLPVEIGCLKKLTLLDFSINKTEKIPAEIGKLKNLKLLCFSSNKVSNLPKEIGNLTELETLFVPQNQISNLPGEIKNLVKLKVLDLASNQFSKFPKVICELTTLERLKLEENKISEIPKEIGKLENLTKFFLQDNNITEILDPIGREIGKLSKLEVFLLGDNPISMKSKAIDRLKELGVPVK